MKSMPQPRYNFAALRSRTNSRLDDGLCCLPVLNDRG